MATPPVFVLNAIYLVYGQFSIGIKEEGCRRPKPRQKDEGSSKLTASIKFNNFSWMGLIKIEKFVIRLVTNK